MLPIHRMVVQQITNGASVRNYQSSGSVDCEHLRYRYQTKIFRSIMIFRLYLRFSIPDCILYILCEVEKILYTKCTIFFLFNKGTSNTYTHCYVQVVEDSIQCGGHQRLFVSGYCYRQLYWELV